MYGWIIGLLLIMVLITVIGRGRFFRRNMDSNTKPAATSSAMETLKERFAKGEIDEEEFEQKKAELEKVS